MHGETIKFIFRNLNIDEYKEAMLTGLSRVYAVSKFVFSTNQRDTDIKEDDKDDYIIGTVYRIGCGGLK
jgi:hypothetical protein